MIYPSSASRIAGSSTSATESFPLPNVCTVSTHAAAAPGTVTEFKSVRGMLMPVTPLART